MSHSIQLPPQIVEFARAMAATCRAHNLSQFHGTFHVNHMTEMRVPDGYINHDVQINWEQGRHGEEADRVTVHTQVSLTTKVDVIKPSLARDAAGPTLV